MAEDDAGGSIPEAPNEKSSAERRSRWRTLRSRIFRRTMAESSLGEARQKFRKLPELQPETQGALLAAFAFLVLISTAALHAISAALDRLGETWPIVPHISVGNTREFLYSQAFIAIFALLPFRGLVWSVIGLLVSTGREFAKDVRDTPLRLKPNSKESESTAPVRVPVPDPVDANPTVARSYPSLLVWTLAALHLASLGYLVAITGGTSASPYMPALMMYCSFAPLFINRPGVIHFLAYAVPASVFVFAISVWVWVKPANVSAFSGVLPLLVTIGTATSRSASRTGSRRAMQTTTIRLLPEGGCDDRQIRYSGNQR